MDQNQTNVVLDDLLLSHLTLGSILDLLNLLHLEVLYADGDHAEWLVVSGYMEHMTDTIPSPLSTLWDTLYTIQSVDRQVIDR